MSSSKHYLYLSKGSSIPNLFYAISSSSGVCLDERLNELNSVYCFISEENLINILESDEKDLIKIKCLVFLNELRRKFESFRGESDYQGRESGWVNFPIKTLHSYLGTRDWPVVRDYLISNEFIECDGKYSVSKQFSMSYRLMERAKKTPACFFVKYTGKIVDYANRHYFDINSVRKDRNIYNIELRKNLLRLSMSHSPEEIANLYPCKDFFSTLGGLYDLQVKQRYFVEDERSGRRFHNFSSISREARRAIRIDGQECSEVDFSACHPWLCLSLYEPGHEVERMNYQNALNEGFYMFLAKSMSADISTGEKYQDFKIGCIAQIFYDFPRFKESAKVRRFRELFPHLSEIIESEKHKSNSDFSIKLQRMEADLMYDGVFFRLMKDEICAIPIHDAVLCKRVDSDRVKLIMEQEFMTLYKYKPIVNKKNLTFV